MEVRSAKSTTYFVKRVHNTLYIEMLYWDENEPVPTKGFRPSHSEYIDEKSYRRNVS